MTWREVRCFRRARPYGAGRRMPQITVGCHLLWHANGTITQGCGYLSSRRARAAGRLAAPPKTTPPCAAKRLVGDGALQQASPKPRQRVLGDCQQLKPPTAPLWRVQRQPGPASVDTTSTTGHDLFWQPLASPKRRHAARTPIRAECCGPPLPAGKPSGPLFGHQSSVTSGRVRRTWPNAERHRMHPPQTAAGSPTDQPAAGGVCS